MSESEEVNKKLIYMEDDDIELLKPECLECIFQYEDNPMICEQYKFHKPNSIMLCEKKCSYFKKR